ncbi:hypothetical protein F5Y14DRAFT_464419 [Nemania sp. NC0429]|nr:hypothetical protein F5Y14DRAFT_464419 [Nemania sp. NC0429]
MRASLLRLVAIPAFAAAATAINIDQYLPVCGVACIDESIAKHTTCAPDENSCICEQIYSVRVDGEVCLRAACSVADYGAVQTGIDKFCAAVKSGVGSGDTVTAY